MLTLVFVLEQLNFLSTCSKIKVSTHGNSTETVSIQPLMVFECDDLTDKTESSQLPSKKEKKKNAAKHTQQILEAGKKVMIHLPHNFHRQCCNMTIVLTM